MYDRSQSAADYTFRLKPNVVNQLREETVNQALQTIERRVNELGVAEPVVARHSGNDQILVQLPGVSDVNRAKEIIRSTALLELKLVEQGPFVDEASARQAFAGNVPPDIQILPGQSEGTAGAPPSTVYYAVRRVAAVTGRDLRNARPSLDENNRPAVSFSLNAEGAQKFGAFTQANINRQLGIVLDGRVYSAPNIQSRIDSEGRITGNFTQQEAGDLGLVLRSGALPASLTYLEERTVGPSLGADSVRAGVMASAGGLMLRAAVPAGLLQARRLQRLRLDHRQPGHPARPDGLPRRDHDAAGHRRLHPDHRHGRRLERAHLRADQGGARRAASRPRRRSPPASTACSGPSSTPTSPRSSPPRSCSSSAPARSAASRPR